ncbi:MAG TPA: tetratricopeptide repeat protein, partial [Egibacteraceae bacterium]|nr:tetratricopeptide repeat protein [Egibacteraceae bacterium]
QDVVARFDEGARCVTLVGAPGIGKTRLALEIATRLDSVFSSGTWWVPLVDVSDPDDVVLRVRHELCLPQSGPTDSVESLVARLRSHQALLVLDNFEHVIEARSVVSALVAGAPQLMVLVTSREQLGIASEHVFPVHPLRCPKLAARPSLEEVAASEAVALFVSRAVMAEPRFRLEPSNCEAVARTCAHLDGIPLAIVLAAGGIANEGITGVEMYARRHLGGFVSTVVDLPPHHRTLDAAIARSWELLSPEEADLFARVAVFSGGFTRAASAAISGRPDGLGARAASTVLDSLARKNLVEARPDALRGPRYELLDTIRSFGLDRLGESGSLEDAQRRHLDYFTGLARALAAGLTGPEQAQSLQVLAQEADNLRAAFDWAEKRAPDEALRLAVSTWRFYLARDIPTGRRCLERALAATPAGPTPERAEALAAAGALAWVTGHLSESEAYLDCALAMSEQLNAPDIAALAWLNKGALGERRDQWDEAERCFMEALRLYEHADDERGRACALVGRGMVCRRRDELDEACRLWTTATQLFASVGDRFNQTMALGNLAWAAEREGRLEEAQDWLAECRRIQIALGDARGLASTTAGLARLAYRRRAYDECGYLATAALVAFHRLGDRPWAASTLISLAAAATRRGRWRPALRLVGAVDALWDLMGATARSEDDDLRLEVVTECRHHLGAGETARAVGVGRAMTLEEALELAVADA